MPWKKFGKKFDVKIVKIFEKKDKIFKNLTFIYQET